MRASEASTSFGRIDPNPGTPNGALKSHAFSQRLSDELISVDAAVVGSSVGVCALAHRGIPSAAIAKTAANSSVDLILIAHMITSVSRACSATAHKVDADRPT